MFEFIHRGTNGAGYVAYGGEFTLNAGLVDAVAWKASVGGGNYIGRVGADVIAHKLSQAFADSSPGVNLRIKDEVPDGFACVRSRA